MNWISIETRHIHRSRIGPTTLRETEVQFDEHLLAYYRKCETVPAIEVAVIDGTIRVVARDKYLAIARKIGVERVRAVVRGTLDNEMRNALQAAGASLIPNAHLAAEADRSWDSIWHVIFAEEGTDKERLGLLADHIVSEVEESISRIWAESVRARDIECDDSGPSVSFRINTPVANTEWYRGMMRILRESSHVAVVVSYQGRRLD